MWWTDKAFPFSSSAIQNLIIIAIFKWRFAILWCMTLTSGPLIKFALSSGVFCFCVLPSFIWAVLSIIKVYNRTGYKPSHLSLNDFSNFSTNPLTVINLFSAILEKLDRFLKILYCVVFKREFKVSGYLRRPVAFARLLRGTIKSKP